MSNHEKSSVDKEFIPCEEALALKELGFDEPCFGFWNDNDSKMYYWNDEEIQNERTNKWFLDTEKKFPKISKNGCTAPTFSQAFRWFREKYDIDIDIDVVFSKHDDGISLKNYKVLIPFPDELFINVGLFTTYEEAELECLKKLIEIVKGGNNEQQ